MKFSERYGYKPAREHIQIESMDMALRNSLWNLLKIHCWDHAEYSRNACGTYITEKHNRSLYLLFVHMWVNFFKKPLDKLNNDWEIVNNEIRGYFFECRWYAVYDFIEFIANNYNKRQFQGKFTSTCNGILEREMSAYRFVDGVITRITEEQEIDEIERLREFI